MAGKDAEDLGRIQYSISVSREGVIVIRRLRGSSKTEGQATTESEATNKSLRYIVERASGRTVSLI